MELLLGFSEFTGPVGWNLTAWMSCECAGVCVGVSEGQIHLKQVSEPLNEGIDQDKNAGLVQDPPFWRIPDIKTNGKERNKKRKKKEERMLDWEAHLKTD